MLERSGHPVRLRPLALGLSVATLLGAAGCGENAAAQAARIFDRYRAASGAKPLTAGGMIRIRLSPAKGRQGAPGLAEIEWEMGRYRESVSSAGMTTRRGIESDRAYYTDFDGVTRVVSDPVLRELRTRSYFWRRAWLFRSREGARASPGPADTATESVTLAPEGGNPLLLSFSRADGRLVSVRSPRFDLEFRTPIVYEDESNPALPVEGSIAWVGLPTGHIPQPYAGGGEARFGPPAAVPFEKSGGAVMVTARLSGSTIRLSVDAAVDGPVRVSPRIADRLPLAFREDVFGRFIAPAASLEIGAAMYPTLFVQRSEALPAGADAAAGACLFREAIVEIDPVAARLAVHGAATWVVPEGYFRTPIDDDEDRPVALLYRGNRESRFTLGSDTGNVPLVMASLTAERLGLSDAGGASGLSWGPIRLPNLPLRVSATGFFPNWGDDGTLGFPLLLRFHAFVNMPQRWIYVKAIEK